MEDIIRRGDGDRPPPSRRKRIAVAAALVAVAALVVAEHLPHGHRQNHAAAPRPLAGMPLPGGIAGSTVRPPASVRVPRTGMRPTWFVPAMGKTESIGGLPASKSGYSFTRLDTGWAIQPQATSANRCVGCPGSPLPVYYLATRAQAATRVGAATMVAPGAGPLWLTSFPSNRSLGTRAGIARPYSTAGVQEGPAVKLPVGFTIAQGTTAGLLLVSITERTPAGSYWLLDPATGKIVRNFWGVIATSATNVAVVRNCAWSCVIDVVNPASGRQMPLNLLGHGQVNAASFSSDGRYLAFAVSFDNGLVTGAATELEVASLRNGQLAILPHTGVISDELAGFGWPGNDDRLAAELVFSTRTQLAFWKPGSRAPAATVVRADQDPGDLVVG